ncbi:UDP-glucose/GDP-mannose dehydrogenase family protein [Marinobacter daepoensis]|uniref:UDP-glucose 6-dehydrogenase n=1 Tax=Marinobacter daepoensis TaxID=262077 RepID=A0ABS3BF97_9GAMM|nr:UDP-glucose/GDP-mannose dehydrogenase family protein [Marinobacter daepoensis]MBN7769377.1 UDP-glucose/GDP-mannose dehydrogenase family protein [Marinobacter daepoensis]MBY6031961.1 UDP-glucose/GDP-mannose dehydrogenase family protein [Marinobacter daepoensis]MBY6078067.1 UDP-glucose/GDP-mannose dehydrogenase family protein [Marinobacter daepoensis]
MKITIFGTGYVGLVTGACLADVGHNVLCMDVDQGKIEKLKNGQIPIYEPGLDNIVKHTVEAGRLAFTTDTEEAVRHGTLQFIAVGTPPDEDGSADLQYVLAVAKSIGQYMDDYKVVVDKSTVPVGTGDKVKAAVRAQLDQRGLELDFDVVSNPEFLKEGAAINDFMKPDRIVVGTESERAAELLREVYYPFNRNHDRMIFMDIRSAELTKYAANALLATKISFMNEVANLAERLGADIEEVRRGIGSDPRIGYHFIYPGCGYGGSCFPKDVQALARTARACDYDSKLLNAVEAVNYAQKHVLFDKVSHYFQGNLEGKVVALWGLSFKPNTDDMREASSRTLMESLWRAGASVQAFDPEAMEETQRIYGDRDDLTLCGTKEQALKGADVLVICTEWKEFRSPDFDAVATALNEPVVFDGRNLYEPEMLDRHGLIYYAIGRGRNQFHSAD